jgi:hypothetical protein
MSETLLPLPDERYACPCDRTICRAIQIVSGNPGKAVIQCLVQVSMSGNVLGCGHVHVVDRHLEIRLGLGFTTQQEEPKP